MKNAIKALSIAALSLVALNASAASNSNVNSSVIDIKPLSVIEKEMITTSETREFQYLSSIKDANLGVLVMQLNELKLANKKLEEQSRGQRAQLLAETVMIGKISEIKNILQSIERRG